MMMMMPNGLQYRYMTLFNIYCELFADKEMCSKSQSFGSDTDGSLMLSGTSELFVDLLNCSLFFPHIGSVMPPFVHNDCTWNYLHK